MTFRNLREIGTIFISALVNSVFFRRKLSLNTQAVKEILVIKLDQVGDVLLSTPVFRNLYNHYPEAEIDVLVGSWSRAVVENIPYISKVWEYNSSFFCRSSNNTSFWNSIKLAKQFRKRKYDMIVELRGDLFTATVVPFSSKCRIARATFQIKDKFFHSDSKRAEHEIDRNLCILEYYGIETENRKAFFDVAQEKRRWARLFLDEITNGSRDLVAIHPGSPVSLKRWSSSNFSELADRLIQEREVQIILVGTEDEKPIIDEIQSKMRYDSFNLAGKTDLHQLGAILQNCVLFIGNDSAPMHIASAVGVHTIGLFGPGSPERFGPCGKHCYAIRKTKCPPCMAEKCKRNIRCVDEISVNDVLEVIEEI